MFTLPFDLALRCTIIHSDGESQAQKEGRSYQQGSHADGCGGYNPACGQEGVCAPSVDTHSVRRGLKNKKVGRTSRVMWPSERRENRLTATAWDNRRNRWKALSLHNLLSNTIRFISLRVLDTNLISCVLQPRPHPQP